MFIFINLELYFEFIIMFEIIRLYYFLFLFQYPCFSTLKSEIKFIL